MCESEAAAVANDALGRMHARGCTRTHASKARCRQPVCYGRCERMVRCYSDKYMYGCQHGMAVHINEESRAAHRCLLSSRMDSPSMTDFEKHPHPENRSQGCARFRHPCITRRSRPYAFCLHDPEHTRQRVSSRQYLRRTVRQGPHRDS